MPEIRVIWTETCTYSQVVTVPDTVDLDPDSDDWKGEIERDEAILAAIVEQGNHASAFQSCDERDLINFTELENRQ